MMKNIIWLLFTLVTGITKAQRTDEHRIQDSVVGWQVKYTTSMPLKPITRAGKTTTKKQTANLDSLLKWVQQSYTPVGGIGTYTPGLINDKEAYSPYGYGLDLRVWNVSLDKKWLDAKGKFRPIPEEYTRFGVAVNSLPGSYPIYFINSPELYLFTWQPNGYSRSNQDQENKSTISLTVHSNIKPYINRINEWASVIIAPNNELPFETVTVREYLNYADQAMDRFFEKEKEKVFYQWKDPKIRDEAVKEKKEMIDRFRENIDKLRIKYKNSFEQQAVLNSMQVTPYTFDGSIDPFEIVPSSKKLNQVFPVYRVSHNVIQKCNTDQPQWISFYFPYFNRKLDNQQIELYKSMTENINYPYIYDYFFNPDATKNKVYIPFNDVKLKERLNSYRKANVVSTQKNSSELSFHYSEDFSSSSVGSKPIDWYDAQSLRKQGNSIISLLSGSQNKWLEFENRSKLFPTNLKFPLPENFTIEYDIATSNFTGRSGGIISLVLEDTKINSSGDKIEKPEGDTRVTIEFIPTHYDYQEGNPSYAYLKFELPRKISYDAIVGSSYFSNFNNKVNKAHITIKKTGKDILVFLNGVQLKFENSSHEDMRPKMQLPEGTRFKYLYFMGYSLNDAKAYLSNIKIRLD